MPPVPMNVHVIAQTIHVDNNGERFIIASTYWDFASVGEKTGFFGGIDFTIG